MLVSASSIAGIMLFHRDSPSQRPLDILKHDAENMNKMSNKLTQCSTEYIYYCKAAGWCRLRGVIPT
jgi:hypothetical protein